MGQAWMYAISVHKYQHVTLFYYKISKEISNYPDKFQMHSELPQFMLHRFTIMDIDITNEHIITVALN